MLIYNASAQLIPDNTISYVTVFFDKATESGRSMGCCDSGNVPLKMSQRENFSLFTQNFQTCLSFTGLYNPASTIPIWKTWEPWTLSFKRDISTTIFPMQNGCLGERRGKVGNDFGVRLRRRNTSKARVCLRHCPHILSHDVLRLDRLKYCRCYKSSSVALLSLCSKAKSWLHHNFRSKWELPDV